MGKQPPGPSDRDAVAVVKVSDDRDGLMSGGQLALLRTWSFLQVTVVRPKYSLYVGTKLKLEPRLCKAHT